jgi:Tfp pilus assembly protein PilX
LAGVSQQPRYLIEPFVWDSQNFFRITARGFGFNATTEVTLQAVYKE